MLGRLFQGAGYSSSLESATEEAHTRALLFPSSDQTAPYTGAISPPPTPDGSPSFRPGAFDDRGELELDETKDFRILIAQDASADQDKPILLFDSKTDRRNGPRVPSHGSAVSPLQSPDHEPPPLAPRANPFASPPSSTATNRNRSSTISGAPNSWTRPVKDAEAKEDTYLDMMFGVTSTIKTGSSTKMHTIIAEPSTVNTPGRSPAATTEVAVRRTPLLRSRTSTQFAHTERFSITEATNKTTNQDSVLITRVFGVNLEPHSTVTTLNASAAQSPEPTKAMGSDTAFNFDGHSKKPKLKQTRTPAFAIGLILNLPRVNEVRPSSRHSNAAPIPGYGPSSGPSSYGSDMHSSWTFLDAIPESLSSSMSYSESPDRRLELIVSNWDVILRCLAILEHEAKAILLKFLRHADASSVGSVIKMPKAKNEQRSNLRAVRLQGWALTQVQSLYTLSRHVSRRVCSALRIPRAMTGLGFIEGGHWLEEARVVSCKSKQQTQFLYSLLTAFLGNHTDWLRRLGPEWYRKRARKNDMAVDEQSLISSRTVIVADQRAVARRLIFLLASFLPGAYGADGLQKSSEVLSTPPTTHYLSTSSPSGQASRRQSLRRTVNKRTRENYNLRVGSDKAGLSTSVSSNDSAGTSRSMHREKPYHHPLINESEASNVKTAASLSLPPQQETNRKTGALVAGTETPLGTTTPVPYFSRMQDSYFPEGVVAETIESSASADLQRLLRRDSSSYADSSGPSTASSKWGSLISGVSGLWSNKETSSSINPPSPYDRSGTYGSMRSTLGSRRRSGNTLQDMVNEAAVLEAVPQKPSHPRGGSLLDAISPQSDRLSVRNPVKPPKLMVDERDGVIDVELNLPGFLSLGRGNVPFSPPGRRKDSLSVASMDGQDSAVSSKSHANVSSDDQHTRHVNVAGFLRRYHPDFALQAVRSYAELQDEIKRSMSLEPSQLSQSPSEKESDGWHTVSTTLIADIRGSAIRRLTLRRKYQSPPVERPSTSAGTHHTPSRPRTAPEESFRPSSASSGMSIEEDFQLVTVAEFDETITEAVQSVLRDASASASRAGAAARSVHSRTVSNSTTSTAKSTPSSVPGRSQPQDFGTSGVYPRSDCRQVVVGALEEIAKSVNDDLNKCQGGRDILKKESSDRTSDKTLAKHDNVLREGVKNWLLNVEQTSVW